MKNVTRNLAIGVGIVTAALAATSASAAAGVVDPCSSAYVNGAIACQGYYGGNMITGTTGSATTAGEQSAITALLNGTASTADSSPTNNTSAYNPPYSLSTGTVLGAVSNLNGSASLNFGSLMLSGFTVLGAHFGNNTDSDENNVTAFWLLNIAVPTNTITLSNGQGSSNAQIFATSSRVAAVPEPGTWAMMLLGFGAVGVGMRRRRSSAGLMQIA